ncbi:MAG: DNA-processing protein DprA [Micrococcales bacterium]|nr:DNA-processing protein DprA [Micrococcales bacterium]
MSDELRARASLSRVVEPRDTAIAQLVATVGPLETLERIVRGHGGLQRFAPRVAALDVERDLAIASRVGARVVIPGDPEWPESLNELAIPPWCLWVRGDSLERLARRSVAVVGSRMATSYGESFAADLGASLASRGWTVVSGAAFGIDAAAHRGALAVDGPTVAVLASGIDRAYPAAHKQLIERVAQAGAVLSEVAPGSAPMKGRFLHRNRIIAAMTAGVVIVEAGLRSGSLNTARHAEELLRPIAAVPGPVTSMSSAGCHQAIRDERATLVTDAAEVIELVGVMGDDSLEPPRGPARPGDALGPADAAVFEALPVRGWMELDRIALVTTMAPLAVRAALARLEDDGLARCLEGRWRKPTPPRKAPPSCGE